jgi:hypothetical protein
MCTPGPSTSAEEPVAKKRREQIATQATQEALTALRRLNEERSNRRFSENELFFFCPWPVPLKSYQNMYRNKSSVTYICKYTRPKRVMSHADIERIKWLIL